MMIRIDDDMYRCMGVLECWESENKHLQFGSPEESLVSQVPSVPTGQPEDLFKLGYSEFLRLPVSP